MLAHGRGAPGSLAEFDATEIHSASFVLAIPSTGATWIASGPVYPSFLHMILTRLPVGSTWQVRMGEPLESDDRRGALLCPGDGFPVPGSHPYSDTKDVRPSRVDVGLLMPSWPPPFLDR